jgi:uncharacterized membrane protein
MTNISTTDASLPARFTESEFRVGRVLNRTSSVLSRNFLIFFVVTAVAHLPALLLFKGSASTGAAASGQEIAIGAAMVFLGLILMIVFSTLSQAIVLYGAFQDMRGRHVSLQESLQVGLSRFFPIIGVAFLMSFLGMLAALALIFPAFILFTMWFVATPVCVVERLGPWKSMRRSRELTKGHRWKIFGLMLLLIMANAIAGPTITTSLTAIGGTPLALVGDVLWNGVAGAFYAISVVVTYHDLRAAKEGVDIDQIAAVFD